MFGYCLFHVFSTQDKAPFRLQAFGGWWNIIGDKLEWFQILYNDWDKVEELMIRPRFYSWTRCSGITKKSGLFDVLGRYNLSFCVNLDLVNSSYQIIILWTLIKVYED